MKASLRVAIVQSAPFLLHSARRGSTYFWRKVASKLLELLQFLSDINLLFPVQQKRDYRLGSASILDGLRREEQGIRRLVVVRAVFGDVAGFLARGVLEEENHTIDGPEVLQVGSFERSELLKLYVLNPELLNQIRENALRAVSVGSENRKSCVGRAQTASDSMVFQPPDMVAGRGNVCLEVLSLMFVTTWKGGAYRRKHIGPRSERFRVPHHVQLYAWATLCVDLSKHPLDVSY